MAGLCQLSGARRQAQSQTAKRVFFLITGYFVAQNAAQKQAVNYSKSLNNLLAIFTMANFVYCGFYLLDADPSTTIQPNFTGLLLGQAEHLWYVGASIFGLLLLQYSTSCFSDKVLLAVALATLAIILAGYNYAGVTALHMQQAVARYATAVPFIFGGFLIARHGKRLQRLPLWACVALILPGFLLECGEAILLYKIAGTSPHNQELLLGTAVMALGFFCLSLSLVTPAPTILATTGRTYLLLIYLYHSIIITLLYSGVGLGKYSLYTHWLSPIIVFGVTLFSLKVIQRISPITFNVLSGQ